MPFLQGRQLEIVKHTPRGASQAGFNQGLCSLAWDVLLSDRVCTAFEACSLRSIHT